MSEKMGGEISPNENEHKKGIIKKAIDQIKGGIDGLETTNEQSKRVSLHLIHELFKKFKSIEFHDYNGADLLKIVFDDILDQLKKALETFEENTLNNSYVLDVVGHQVTRGSGIYTVQKEYIPESEHGVHSRGKALECLRSFHYQAFDEVLDYYGSTNNTQMVERVTKAMEQNDKKVYQPFIDAYTYQGIDTSDIEVEAAKDFFKRFPRPFLTMEEEKKILQELIDKLEAAL